jgi:hypothetical protein
MVWKHLAGQSLSQRLQQPDGGVAGVATARSPAAMAYVTTETGVVTMIIMVLVAGYLLTRRAADFKQAEPKTPLPTTSSPIAARRARAGNPR